MSQTQRVIVTGATGAIGRPLCAALAARGYELVVFSRDPAASERSLPQAAEHVAWDPSNAHPSNAWARTLEGAYAVIHLAGAPLFGRRWNRAFKEEIYRSRVLSTWSLATTMAAMAQPPAVFISSSAVGYYGQRDDTRLSEAAPVGSDYLAQVCRDWEAATIPAVHRGIRTVQLRTGIVLDPDAGALAELTLPFRFGVGGPILPGTQWMPWIHLADEIGLIEMALENTRVHGPLNAAAPEPVTNRTLSSTIGKIMHRPSWFPVPGFVLRILFGEFASFLTHGQRVIPTKALALGYRFLFPELEPALRDLLRKR